MLSSLLSLSPRLLGDSVGSLIVRAVSGGLVVKVISMGLAFAAQLVLANTLGASEYGKYLLVLGWLAFLLPLATLGTGESVVRLVGQYVEGKEHRQMNGVIVLANIVCVAAALLVGGALVMGVLIGVENGWIAEDLKMVFILGAALLPLMSLSAPRKGALRALLKAWQSLIPDGIVKPALIALFMAVSAFYFNTASAETAMLFNMSATLLAFLFGTYLLHRALPEASKGSGRKFHTAEWLRISVPFTLLAWLYVALSQADVVMLGMFKETSEVGIFAAAHKLGSLALFGSSAVWAIAAPMVARAYKAEEQNKLRKIAVISVRVNFLLTFSATLVLLLFGSQLLTMFGNDFTQGESILRVLAIGYPVSAAIGGGMVGFLLTMTGRQMIATYIVAGAALTNIILNLLLIPEYGGVGAAIATVVAIFLMNLAKLIAVMKVIRINPTLAGRMG